MSKKLISIFLCLIMFAMPMLVSCGGSEADGAETGDSMTTEEARVPMTLTLWLPTDDSTTDEAIKLVEDELNKLMQAKYDTAIELHAIRGDDYQSVIDDRIKEIDDVQKAAEEAAESERLQKIEDAINCVLPDENEVEETEDTSDESETFVAETEVNEYGQAVTVYPDVEDDQLDIFLVKGYDNYKRYIDEGLIESLDADLNDVGKKLRSYIYPTFFDLAKVDGMTYGVPNNHALGDYQFLLVNKRLVEEYSYDPEELSSYRKCEDFIFDIASQDLPGVTPLLGEVEPSNMVYFSNDGKWSLFAAQIQKSGIQYNSEVVPTNVFMTEFASTYSLNRRLSDAGYVGDGVIDEGEEFAVGVISCDSVEVEKYQDEYYIYTQSVPVADLDDALESVFCVSKYTKSTKRSMEVITYLNTDETVRTLLQYGVEGIHWEESKVNGEDVLTVLKPEYKMNIVDTGNVYLTYPEEGVPKSYWKYAQKQNLESSTNPFIGFEYITEDNEKYFKALATESAKVYARLEAASGSEIQAIISELITSTGKLECFKLLSEKEGSEKLADSLVFLYNEYLKSKR